MIDFKNGAVFKLSKAKKFSNQDIVQPLFIDGEELIGEYQALRDFVIFTNKRIISVNVQGITGKKKDFSTLPYSKIQAFSIETAGTLDLDSELELYFSGLGKVKFEFTGESDIVKLGKLISGKIL
nr:PH domain-containing protein [uncultured Anaerotignum sp.]